jgi:hypothetical protein
MIFEPLDEKGLCDFCSKKRMLWSVSTSGGDFEVCRRCGESMLNERLTARKEGR